MTATPAPLPFAGLTVIELGTVIAGPFAGSLMADLGATVIKVEPPGPGDAMRGMGHRVRDVPIWWGVGGRSKQCITLNLKHARGKALLMRLVEKADVLIENYRPGVLDRLGLGLAALQAANPGLVVLSISGYGHTGPESRRGGFGKIAEGMSGVVALTGSPEDRPLFVGFSMADASSGLLGVFAVAVALYDRDALGSGRGGHVDLALYEPLLRMLDCQLALRDRTGAPPMRQGSGDPYGWGQADADRPFFKCVRHGGGGWLLMMVPREALGRLQAAARLAPDPDRLDGPGLERWAAGLDAGRLREAVIGAGAHVAPVHDGTTIAADGYFRARGDVLTAVDPVLGPISVPGHVGRMADDTRTGFRAQAVGEHTEVVLRDRLGVDAIELAALRNEGAV